MSFIRTRTIKGRKYSYLEIRWREGKKVRSKSIYLGPGEGRSRRYGMPASEEVMLREYNDKLAREEAVQKAWMAEMHALYGMRQGSSTPTPIDKATMGKETPVSATGARVATAPSNATPTTSSASESHSSVVGATSSEASGR